MQLQTDRLILREYTMNDFTALYEIMSDAETMQHYPTPLMKPVPDAGLNGILKIIRNMDGDFGLWF